MREVRQGPQLDLGAVPWSRRGAYLTLSTLVPVLDHPGRTEPHPPGLYLFDVSGSRFFGDWNGILRLTGVTGTGEVPLVVRSATPERLELGAGAGGGADAGTIEATWDGPDTIRLRGQGAGLRMTLSWVDPLGSDLVFPTTDRTWVLILGENPHLALTCIAGELAAAGPRVRTGPAPIPDETVVEASPGPDGRWELALTQYVSGHREPAAFRPFDDCVAEVADELQAFTETAPPVPAGFEGARSLAKYLTWSCLVGPRGKLQRPSMLMSKNWMYATWSWDHCFNAFGLAAGQPDLAWDQLMTLFDQQHPAGSLPDLVHDAGAMYGFVKPPIHGWTVRRLERAGVITDARAAELYPRLAAWTDWWFTYRDPSGGGLPEYHHGNDSGWDNATVFDMGFPAASPDLAAYLVIQLDVLAGLAQRLGRPTDESAAWRQRADELLARMLERLWDGTRFRALRTDGAWSPDSRSIIPFVPMILGDRLPADVRTALVVEFRASGLLTPFGVATEAPDGPLHEADGYWRGPIWAPTTLLTVDGLQACGEAALARDVAGRYLELCQRSGFSENYEATTGRPLRDLAYTWAASTFLVLGSELA